MLKIHSKNLEEIITLDTVYT